MQVSYRGVVPFFGILVSGLPGSLICLALAGLWVWLGWLWYQNRPVGWWILLGATLVLAVSSLLSFSRIDLVAWYRQMHLPTAQAQLLQREGLFTGKQLAWWLAGALVPLIGYLLWVKRYFGQPTKRPAVEGGEPE